MAYTVKIGGVDKTSLISTRSLIIRLGADHRGSADFAIITTTSYLPRAGQAILIEDTGTVFAGLITSAPQVRVGASTSIRVNVSAQGLYAVPGRRCASETYADIDSGDIVSDLITSYLAAEGITAGTITAGAHLDAYDTYGKTIGAVLDELASVSGYQWYIDTAKALHFVQDIVIADAAHDLDEAGAFTDYGDVQINEDLDQYRNRQIIRGGIQSDGTALSYVAEDAAEIAARAAIEGGSGVYENVYTDTNIIDATNAAAVASNLLKKYGRVSLAISFTSLTTDWRPATKLKVNLPSLGISTDRYFLVERVTLQDIGGATLRVLVEGVTKNESDFSTQMRDRYIDYFAKLLAGQKQVRDYTNQVAAGKTKTYFQAAQPTGGTYIPGDTWFDTDDDNRIYEWSGSAWVAVQFGENAIADLAITNAKIADATIQAAKIGTVHAGSITAGTLNAARIAASSITFDKLASAAVTSITDTIDLGGRNLLRNTGSTFTETAGWIGYGNHSTRIDSNVLVIDSTGAGNVSNNVVAYANVASGQEYTLSFSVYSASAQTVHVELWGSVGATDIAVTAGWQRVSCNLTGSSQPYFYIWLAAAGSVALNEIMLEKGNKATDWTPAPEDKLSEGVSYAGVEIDATNGFVSTATIGGNTIQTKANATDGFSIFKGSTKMFGVDTNGRVFASSLSNVDSAGYHMTYGYGGSPGLECFLPIAGTPTKFLGISPSANGDIYLFDKNTKNRLQVWVDGTFRITDHNQATRMYLYPNGGIEFKDINGYVVIAANGGALEDVYLACKNAPTMKVGTNSTGPFYDYGGARVYFNDVPSKTLATSGSSGSGGASKWIRVARFTFGAQYSYVSSKLEIVGTASSTGAGMGCTLYFTGVQQSAFPNNPVGNLYLSNAVNITTSDLVARVTYTASDSTVVEVYVKSIHDSKYIRTFRTAEYSSNVLPDYTLTSWLASAPSGTDLGKVLCD